MENEIALNEATIEERDQGIREIQQQIGEVNEIFKDLAVLVHEQGTMIGKPWAIFIFSFTTTFPNGKLPKGKLPLSLPTLVFQMTSVQTLETRTWQPNKLHSKSQKLPRPKSLYHQW